MKRSEKRVINKKSQVTIFIIIAIVLAVILIIIFWPKIKIIITKTSSPGNYIQNCAEDKIKQAIKIISSKGGSINPVLFIDYKGEQVEYLCYTNEYYKTCIMQQPLLKQHVEYEINNYVEDDIKLCVESFKNEFEKRGYSVSVGKVSVSTNIVPDNVVVNIKAPVSIKKGEESLKYDNIKINIRSKIYNFLMIASSILNWEARYGDSDPLNFMVYYPNLKVEKLKQGDGSKIYILTDLITKDSFSFATRSLSWPAGYGIGEKVR